MKLESNKMRVQISQEKLFEFLSDIKNFESLMPSNISKFELQNDDCFSFALKGMPEVFMKTKEVSKPNSIVLESAKGKIDFTLTAVISGVEPDLSVVQLLFDGQINPMLAMMVKKPLAKFVEALVNNIPNRVAS